MEYRMKFSPLFEKQLKKLKKKDKILCLRLLKKLEELKQSPEHYKPLRNVLKGKRGVHLDPFVIVFEVQDNIVLVHYVKHHDKAY